MATNDEASPICRGKNLSWETIMLFYNYMPNDPMPKNEFNAYVEKNINGWTQTHSQVARQLAFYYEKDGICYPRFNKKTSLAELYYYIHHWAHNYFIPNPYAPSLKGKTPTNIYSFIKNQIQNGKTDFHEAFDSMFGLKFSSHDKVRVYLSNFTDILFEDNYQISINKKVSDKALILEPTLEAATDPEAYFNHYGALNKGVAKSSSESILSYLTAIRTKPFLLLAGISGTGKSRIVRKLAQATDDIDTFAKDEDRWKLHSPQNFQLIQVKPNWHNSMDLVGFKSNIGGEHYEMTPFIEFVAKAWQHQDTPFFLCLDEMNLAPVEEYFAEFLSAIESRSNEGGSYETDPIIKPFRDFGEKVATEMIDKLLGEKLDSLKAEDIVKLSLTAQRFLTMGLTLPKNLIVMGTVNMDETTFSFSRKVLDRAMSIEMNEVMYEDFLSGKTENDIEVLVERNSDLVNRPISGLKVKDEDSQSVINFLSDINTLLDNTPYKLGYRAANEALLYVSAAKTFGCNDWKKAMDDFTLMKILSRIEGDDSKLKTQDGKDLLSEFKYLLSSTYGFSEESKTLKKLNQMINILDRDKFVSFWG